MSLAACSKPGRHKNKRGDNEKSERNMHDCENPGWKIIVNNHAQETGYKRKASVRRLSGKMPQIILPHCKRAENTDHRLEGYQTHGREMEHTEHWLTYPPPSEESACEYARLSSHRKEDIKEVDHGNEVSTKGIISDHLHLLP